MRKTPIILALLLASLVAPAFTVNASWGESDAVDGYVYCNGAPAQGIKIEVYRVETGLLEGEGVISREPGTEYTDVNGYFKIYRLYAHGKSYEVKAYTPCGVLTQTVQVWCGSTTRVEFRCESPPPGTGTPGYWKTHPEAWPVDEVTIGGVTYTKKEALEILWAHKNMDKTYTMFAALVAAKLNIELGNPYHCIEETLEDADEWMASYGPVGSRVRANSYAWKVGEPLYWVLDDYNNGLLCAPSRD